MMIISQADSAGNKYVQTYNFIPKCDRILLTLRISQQEVMEMKKTRILSLLLCFALVWTMMPAAAFAQGEVDDKLVYLALGDSITTGFGLDGKMDPENSGSENASDPVITKAHDGNFVNLLAEEFEFDTVYNESKNGNTVAGIAAQLTDSAVQTKVAEADIITITVGGNDLMALLYSKMAEMYNATKDPDITAEDVITKLSGLNQSNLLANLTLLTCAQTLLKEDSGSYLMDSQDFTAALEAYQQALVGITGALKQMNPAAEIIVATQYNPYGDFNGVKLYNMADLTPLYAGIEDGATKLNAAIAEGAALGGYHVADAKTAFDAKHSADSSLYNASPVLTAISLDFHPTAAGHKVLAEVFGDVIAEIAAPSEPEAGITGVSVTPASAELKKGSIQEFAAEVSGTGQFSETVTWSITGASSFITHIDTDGILYIGVDETAASITVTAAAEDDESKSASAEVSIENGYATEDLGIAYQAYLATKAELAAETKSLDSLRNAFSVILNNEIELDYDQLEVLPDDYFTVSTDASAVLRYSEYRDAFEADKSAGTADALVEFCGSIESAGRTGLVKSFYPDYDAVAAEAQRYAPSANAKLVYNAYDELKNLLESGYFADEITGLLENFSMAKNVYDNLTAEDLEDLAGLMGSAPADVKNIIEEDVKAAGIIAAFNTEHEAVIQGQREEAQLNAAFKAAYEAAVNPSASSERVRTLFAGFFEETYNDVLTYIQPEPVPPAPSVPPVPTVPYVPVDPVGSVRASAAAAVNGYVDTADYEAEEAAAIQVIAAQAKKDMDAAKTVEEVEAIEAAAKAEIDKLETAAEKALIAEVKAIKFSTKSTKTTLKGNPAVKISWTVPESMDFDGYEVYRSTKRYSGFGSKPFFTADREQYINNKGLKKGRTYYYKVRGFKFVNDEKVYTEYSFKAWRTI